MQGPEKLPFRAFYPRFYDGYVDGKSNKLPEHLMPKVHINYENRMWDYNDNIPKFAAFGPKDPLNNDGTPKTAEKITVEYFGMGYGRADPIRFLLHHANVDFEYVGYDFAKWGELKGSGKGGEFNGLPRVTIDGKEYGQSLAILRMLGAKHGYYTPSDWQCAARVDLFLDAWVDMLDKSTGLALSAGGGKDMAEVLKEHETVIKNVHEPAIKAMEAQLT